MAKVITPETLAASGTEDGHQTAFFCFAATVVNSNPLWNLLFAIPNGGKREPATAARLKATGTKSGFPDIGFPVARHNCHGLYIEMKRPELKTKRYGGLSEQQIEWHNQLRNQGYATAVAYGWEHARDIVEAYLSPKEMQ